MWFIITSEEIDRIHEQLSDIEQDLPDRDRDCAREITRIIETVERRMA
jgi:16S rRNA C1402 (ribose-2'-O) methylase RsmI